MIREFNGVQAIGSGHTIPYVPSRPPTGPAEVSQVIPSSDPNALRTVRGQRSESYQETHRSIAQKAVRSPTPLYSSHAPNPPDAANVMMYNSLFRNSSK